MIRKFGHIVILYSMFVCFLWCQAEIAIAQGGLEREGPWGEKDDQADRQHSRGLKIPPNWPQAMPNQASDEPWTVFAMPDDADRALPPVLIWRTGNPIRDQGACGACWAFATTSVVESLGVLTNNGRYDLSEQATLSCSRAGSCAGGFFDAFNYLSFPGTTSEATLPYYGQDIMCPVGLPTVLRLYNWSYIGQPGREPSIWELKTAIKNYGPIAVAVNGSFGDYRGGVFDKCNQAQSDHMVNIEGWDDIRQAWLIRNSWGPGWGEGGWGWIKYTDSQGRKCNRIGEIAAFAVLAVPRAGPQ
jgi:C1A family cysteine protease